MAKKYSFKQFQSQYSDDDACLDAIMERRYGHIDCCPKCGFESKLTRIEGRRAYACQEGCHIYPCAGTVFEKSTTSLTSWFHAMYLMTATRNGVSAKELERQLGVTYKCAWRIGHKIRELMDARNKSNTPSKLSGHVEIDETFIGGYQKTKKGKLQNTNKTVVFGMVKREGDLKAHVVPNTKGRTLIPLIKDNIEKGSTISSDDWRPYRKLSDHGYNNGRVKHQFDQWRNGIHHTNSIEGFWSHLKRGIRSTHTSVSAGYLQNYVNEFTFRYNYRHDPANMFRRLLTQISQG